MLAANANLGAEVPAADAPEPAKRRQILDGARQVFLDMGFDGASMNDVARVSGVSKGTLYVYFPSKEALFEAFVRDEKRRQAEQICQIDNPDSDFSDVLDTFGRNFVSVLTQPEALAHMRTVLGVASRTPSIGHAFYEAGPSHGLRYLAGVIAERGRRGELVVDDPYEAAGVFVSLLKSDLFSRVLFRSDERTDAQEIAQNAARAVRLFMRLYGPPSSGAR